MEYTSQEEEFVEAEDPLIAATRAVNEAVRRAHKTGFDVKADIITMSAGGRAMPQITFWTPDWQRRA